MKGHKQSEVTRLKISKSHMGMRPSKETLKKLSKSHKGKKQTEETKLKRSKALKKAYLEGRRKPWNKDKKHTEEHKKKISEGLRGMFVGEKSYMWKGGISTKHEILRHSLEYRLWRTAVFERDNYTCIWCGQKGGKLEADHIKPFAYYPELRFAIDNGRTLCIDCHRKTDTWGNNGGKEKYGF